MADGFVAVAPDSTGKIIDATELVVGTKAVERQRINVADPANPAAIQSVTAPGTSGAFASAIQGVINGIAVLISGTVTIAALPGSPAQDGTDATGVAQVAGGVGIRGWLSSIYNRLSGTLTTTLAAGANAIGSVSVSNFPATQPVNGTVGVNNFPATQPISGSVAVTALPGSPAQDATVAAITAKLPASPALDGTDATGVVVPAGAVGIRGWLSSIYNRLSGTLTTSVSNFPATQPVSGTVGVSNFPATQPISGSVAVSTLPGSPAQDGTDATGVVVPAGAVGIRGWLSGIYRALTGTLNIGSGTVLTILTPTSPIAVTSIKASAGRAVKLVNASTSAQNVTISLFNESTTVGAAATLIYSAILGASQVIALDIVVPNGLSYSLSAAPLANIIVVSS